MFADKYDDLYTSVPYDNTEMDVIVKHINSGVVEFNHDCVINFSDVEDGVRGLKPAKHDGYAGLSTDYFINGCDELYVHIALLFSAMIVHGIVFDDLLMSSIIPISKSKNINCTDSANYRGIALRPLVQYLVNFLIG